MKELNEKEMVVVQGGWSFDSFMIGIGAGILAGLVVGSGPIGVVVGAAAGALSKEDLQRIVPDPDYIDCIGTADIPLAK
jgi:uncharacterized membrane protein